MEAGEDKRVLAIFEHPLQEIEAVGSIVAQYTREDVRVILLSPSCGKGSGVDCEDAWHQCDTKLLELAKKLGFEVVALGYNHNEWVTKNNQELTEYIGNMINLMQPKVVITSASSGGQKPSQEFGLSEIVTQAFNQFYNKGVLMYACSH